MRLSVKIVLIWMGMVALYLACALIFPHRPAPLSALVNRTFQSLLLVISIFLVFYEPVRKNKFIFVNFAIYGVCSLFSFAYDFPQNGIFGQSPYARHFFMQYLTIAYAFTFAVAAIYVTIDLLFRDMRVVQKYAATLAIVLTFFGFYFFSYFSNPMYLYSTEEIKQWKALSTYVGNKEPVPPSAEIANHVTLKSWKDGVAIGELYPAANLRRIQELTPYLESENWSILLWQPLYKDVIYANVLVVMFCLMFFGYQYRKDPPQGAYIDKIMFLLLLIASMDILHFWGFIKSVEESSRYELFMAGQYVTDFAELLMVLFFGLRLWFVTSPQGEFYEHELAENPKTVSRWRDWVDNMVLAHFFNFRLFNGRMFQDPGAK